MNILGLSIGMTCYLLIFQYVSFETGYDRFHENRDNIYRVQRNVFRDNKLNAGYAKTSFSLGPALKEEFPEITEALRCLSHNINIVSCRGRRYRNEKVLIAESSIFKIFSFKLIKGDPGTALSKPGQVAISCSLAKKYFGPRDPLGKTIHIADRQRNNACTITGVFEDVPGNSHLQFDMLVSLETFANPGYTDWVYCTVFTFILVSPDADPELLEAKLPGFINKYIIKPVPLAKYWKFHLQPLRDIYLYSNLTYDTQNGNGQIAYLLFVIALLILIISWFNYINLQVARSLERAKEIGIKKVMGSHRFQLVKHFLFESIVITVIPVFIALILAELFIPYLRELTGKNIPLFRFSNNWFWMNTLVLYLVSALLTGGFPAVVLSALKPSSVLRKGKWSQTTIGITFKKYLTLFQYAVSSMLIVFTLIVYRQIQYMRNTDLGMDTGQMLILKFPYSTIDGQYKQFASDFKKELLLFPGILSTTYSSHIPGSPPNLDRLTWLKDTDFKSGKILSIIFIDAHFIPTYKMKVIAGRNFHLQKEPQNTVVLNEEARKMLGFTSPQNAVNKRISSYQIHDDLEIIGVIKNYHHQTLKKNLDPIVFIRGPDYYRYFSVKMDPTDIDQTLGKIKQKWKKYFKGFSFQYFFLDDYFNRQYAVDRQFGLVMGTFTLLAIMINCIGLFSLNYLDSLRRTKEIGIRKSFGASRGDILRLLTGNILKLILTAVIFAWPVAFLVAREWLNSFAYHISIPFSSFIASVFILIVISLLTVGYNSLAAASKNPADILREE